MQKSHGGRRASREDLGGQPSTANDDGGVVLREVSCEAESMAGGECGRRASLAVDVDVDVAVLVPVIWMLEIWSYRHPRDITPCTSPVSNVPPHLRSINTTPIHIELSW
eukprot:TRINITY_DN10329_c0_g1_i2.p1 TRINITY_DN10329_c0_g1~~TRINITY_DN10329_c0_g1_i2.p1  ORF type:complete len:109 (+),score=4.31 TRINITY_DN10329_c0_g1_i2:251-577(+)